MPRFWIRGSRIGTTISTIGTHSSGQPSRKITARMMTSMIIGGSGRLEKRLRNHVGGAKSGEHGTEIIGRRHQQQDHARYFKRRVDRILELLPGYRPRDDGHHKNNESTARACVGRRGDAYK